MAFVMFPLSAQISRSVVLCALILTFTPRTGQGFQNPSDSSIEPNLVGVNIIVEIRGVQNAVELNGRQLTNYSPIIIQVFSSTGIVLDHEVHIMTFLGYHWVDIQDRDPRIEITARGAEKREGRMVGIDQSNGVAVIQLLNAKLRTTPICAQCEIKGGTTVMAPVKGDPSPFRFREAQVLSVGTERGFIEPEGWVIAVNHPFPEIGQPILSSDRRVLGFIASQDPMGTRAIVYPIKQMLASAERILREGGDIRIGWLGVFLADSPHASNPNVMIQGVEEDSPAEKAGLIANDLLIKYDGQQIQNARQFIQYVQDTPIGSEVSLEIVRREEPMTLTALIEARRPHKFRSRLAFNLPETQTSSPFGAIPNTEPLIPRPLVGLEAIMLTPDLADALQLPEQTGLLVTQVARQMPADLAGVRVGDVIVAMDGQPITDAQNFSAYLHSGSWGTQLALRVSRKGVQSTITIQLPAMGR